MSLTDLKDAAAIFQSIVTPIGLIIAGVWAYRRYVLEDARYPHVESSAQINFIGQQGDFWIVELRAILENKGKVSHRIKKCVFYLRGANEEDSIDLKKKQIYFPREIVSKGSFIPQEFQYFAVGPGITANYSFIARVPKETTFLFLQCEFDYLDDRAFSHSWETIAAVPRQATQVGR